MTNRIHITPKTKVAELLDNYPELEDFLIGLVPEFKKLKNPILRKTIAKITSLENAASVAEIKIDFLINSLRKQVGQDELDIQTADSSQTSQPDWLDKGKISKTLDARPIIQNGGHPLGDVIRETSKMKNGEIFELITPFMPAPLIDKVTETGFSSWSTKESPETIKTYFIKIQKA
jgi:uncharacterized protein (DUF2249 family)